MVRLYLFAEGQSERTVDYKEKRVVVGPQVAETIGLISIRAKCPHLHRWLTKLEQLGTTAGGSAGAAT